MRLDKGDISIFAEPYSTVVHRGADGSYAVRRVPRPKTPLKQLLAYKAEESWRRFQSKWFRFLPNAVKDRKLEARYQAIMGTPSRAAPQVEPGSDAAAVAEKSALRAAPASGKATA